MTPERKNEARLARLEAGNAAHRAGQMAEQDCSREMIARERAYAAWLSRKAHVLETTRADEYAPIR